MRRLLLAAAAFSAAGLPLAPAGRKLPVNLVLVAEGEEEIGSPNIAQIVRQPQVQAALAVLKRRSVTHALWPRLAGSYPGYIFTDPPLNLPGGHFGLGYGGGAHAPDEFLLIASGSPQLRGYDDLTLSFAEYLYELAR